MPSSVGLSKSDIVREARLKTLRKRDLVTGRAIVGKALYAVKTSRLAQKRKSHAIKTPYRRSQKLLDKAPAVPVSVSPAGSTGSTSSVDSNNDRQSDVSYTPGQAQESRSRKKDSYETPPGYIYKDTARPQTKVIAKTFVSDDGLLRCSMTGQDNDNGIVQLAHALDRSADPMVQRQQEIIMGVQKGGLSLDTRPNMIPLSMEIHRPMDRGQVIILPTLPTLCKLWKALSTKTITDWSKKRSPYMNEEGYLYHDDVFPRDTEIEVMIVPMSNWSKTSGIQHISYDQDGNIIHDYYKPPFVVDGKAVLPLKKVKASPYFMARKAHWALTKEGAGQPPAYVEAEIQVLLYIGELMNSIRDAEMEEPLAGTDADQQLSASENADQQLSDANEEGEQQMSVDEDGNEEVPVDEENNPFLASP
ncbi:hypothetical protein GGG16DRAFT_56149 [Schizophyllum commune]